MRKILLSLAVLCGTICTWAAVDPTISGKGVAGVGKYATTISTDTWYLLHNHARNCYVSEENTAINMRGVSNFSQFPFGADEKAGYMFKFEPTDQEGRYYIKSGNGLYFTITQGGSSVSSEPVSYTIGQIGENLEHFYAVMDSDGRVLDGNADGGTLAGWDKNIPTTTGGNNCYHFLPLEFIDAEIWTVYQKGLSAAASLPYAIQQAYGLVTDAAKFTSNAKETEEGSYEALIDNVYNDPSYFHTSWSKVIGDYHYLQVEVAESIKDFYFYFKKRQGNNNNRPIEIEIQGSANGTEFATITTITEAEGLPVDATVLDYMSDKISASSNVKHIRFVIKATNNNATDGGHPFFTFSEFYVLSSNNDVASLVASYKAFASLSFLSPDLESVVEDLVNAESVLSLANIKKEIKSVLDANESNHAATPALGQYTTTDYNALKAAYEASDATQESLEKAIEDFRYAKNLPVFTINGVVSYASGKSIYDGEAQNDKGNTHYFKTTNLYDKTMWWALDLNTTTVGVAEEVGIYNVGTHKNFWNSSTIKITETNENDGAGITDDGIFLFYTTGNNTPIHYQKDGSLITRWSSYDAASGSAHKFTYVGNTYELANLTDEKIQALAALKTAYDAKAYYKNAEIGDGLGQYKGDKDAIVAELAKAEAVYVKTLAEQAAMTVEEINAITKSITDVAALTLNLPTPGKYYLIHSSLNLFAQHQAGKVKAVYSDGTNVKWTTANEDDKTFYWQAVATSDGGVALQNAMDGKYMTGKDENGAWTVSDTYTDAAKLDMRLFAKGETADKNEYGVILNGWQMHCYGHDNGKGESGNVISWNTDNANSASSWYVVEVELSVFYDVTYNFVYNGEVKFSQTSSIKKDAAYPDIVVPAIPYGVTTKATKPEGTVTKNEVVNFELTIEKELPFVTAQSAENITKWYYMRMHTNQPGFIGDIAEDNTINVAWGKTATADKLENFMWGFVGDVFGGITVVNKGTGLQLNSTGDGNATLAETGTSFFIAATTETSANAKYGFCLRKKDSKKYLNANYGAGKLSHWESTDAGSTFFLTEADKATKVKVSNAGYATLFLDYATYIPKEVEAYIVASIDNTSATLAQVTGTLPEKTGVIVKAAEGVYNFTASAEAAASVSGNLLRGSVEDAYIEGEAYVLANAKNGVGLYKAELNKNANGETGITHFLNNANKAYLPKPAETSARFLSFDFGTETAIDELKGENGNVKTVIYDLSGRRVQKAQKGVFIVNGKVVIK